MWFTLNTEACPWFELETHQLEYRKMSSPVTRTELYDVAKVTAKILESCGIPCFLVGGVACSAYGTTRLPNVSHNGSGRR